MPADNPTPRIDGAARTTLLGAAAIAAILGFASVYVTLGRPDNASRAPARAPPTEARPPSGPGANALSRGDMAAFVFRPVPEALPEVRFQDAGGAERSLAEWRGKVVLLNLWATWCLPCRKEMPALDRLQGDLGSGRFEVVALSVDRTGLAGARKFLEDTGAGKLALYADGTARMGNVLRVAGLPATILIDAEGREVGRLLGPAEWDGEDAKRLIGATLGAN